MNKSIFLAFIIVLVTACSTVQPLGSYSIDRLPTAPDYSNADAWAALPTKKDPADRTPGNTFSDEQSRAEVDVFFVHPTTYLGKKGEDYWIGPVDQEKLNKRTDESTILHQASIFNGAGRVYAPRYRQAHYHAYLTQDKSSAKQAFAQAYVDVKAAFKYYLENYNEGRPVIIAGHSQGTTHASYLIKEFFDGKALFDQLVAAYLVGMPVTKDFFENITPCQTPEDIQCYCSWRTWQREAEPTRFNSYENVVVTNPLIWTIDTTYADKSINKGTVLRNFNKGIKPGITDAQVHEKILWVTKPKFFGSFLWKTKNYHVADYNLFYVNVRENAQRRADAFLNR